MSRTFRGLAAGAAAVLAFTGISLTVASPAQADQDKCTQIAGGDNGGDNGGGGGDNGGQNGNDDNKYDVACKAAGDGHLDACIALLVVDDVKLDTAIKACKAAHEDGGGDDQNPQPITTS
ncbi:hypothetical protein [Actinophytocola sp.]|uniref:hypothetical protein n=1 Tax=Actinophytocola sp. TaxID=1872138 RepID=UPI00389B323D